MIAPLLILFAFDAFGLLGLVWFFLGGLQIPRPAGITKMKEDAAAANAASSKGSARNGLSGPRPVGRLIRA